MSILENISNLFSSSRDDESGEPVSAPRTRILTREGLYDLGCKIAAEQGQTIIRRKSGKLYRSLESNCDKLEISYATLTELDQDKRPLTPGVEWFLDNYHIVEKHILDLRNHFPPAYDKSLPKIVKGAYAGYPRVYQLALDFLNNTDSVLELSLLNSLVRGYQDEGVTLTIGEVWAIPIMLRLALLETLETLTSTMLIAMQESHAADKLIEEIIGEEGRPGTDILLALAAKVVARPDFLKTGAANLIRRLRDQGPRASLTLQWLEERLRETGREPEEILRSQQFQLAADQISIANVVNSLKALGYINWQDWFEETNKVEVVLRKDPTGIYPRGDFKTRDYCRHVIEKLARRSGKSEVDLAAAAVELAVQAAGGVSEVAGSRLKLDRVDKKAHVGYYLLAEGRDEFERHIQFTPNPLLALGRFLKREAFLFYSVSCVALSFLLILKAMTYSVIEGGSFEMSVLVMILCIIPATEIVGNFVQWLVCHLTVPSLLPKLDFSEGIPRQFRTAVVVHVLLSDLESVQKALEALHVRYLANPDANLLFGLLADFRDADSETLPSDEEIRFRAKQIITALNDRYGGPRFFVLFRKRKWNESEGCFMAWERKRGKVEEFNHLVLGSDDTSFELDDVPVDAIRQCRFVITLDADARLPRGTAQKLVGTMAHPLNRPVVDPQDRVVREGYGIIQPRVGVSLTSAYQSLFSRIFSGHSGLDPYTQTVSDVYQDLFGEASYIGKGIYDVRAFAEALDDRVPENALLSHDLFEGSFARCALATDIELFDDFPSRYHVHAKRQHRWIRGDWQLLPWVFDRIPDGHWKRMRSSMSGLARWKLLDNLRRSLVAPSIFALLVASWTLLPGSPLFWTLFALLVVAFPVYANLAQALIIPPRGLSMSSHMTGIGRDMYRMSKQAALTLAFLPHQALLSLHAMVLTLIRMFVTRRHLLEWETHYHSERRLTNSLTAFLVEMAEAIFLSTVVLIAVAIERPESLVYGAPFLLIWLISPFIASALSKPLKMEALELDENERAYLQHAAYDTWKFFRDNLNEENSYLIPDNVQLVPNYTVAHRTSPTNISLSMLASCSAYDLGFIPSTASVGFLEKITESLLKLERFKGQFLNWYATDDLRSLYPRYISMVDSGNLLGHFVALGVALHDLEREPLVNRKHLQHISNSLKALKGPEREGDMCKRLTEMSETLMESRTTNQKIARIMGVIAKGLPGADPKGTDETLPNRKNFIEDLRFYLHLYEWFEWVEIYELFKTECGIDTQIVGTEVRADTWSEVDESLSNELLNPKLAEMLIPKVRVLVESIRDENPLKHTAAFLSRCEELISGLDRAESVLAEFRKSTEFVAHTLDEFVRTMDFRFLFDEGKNLFVIGYNVDSARRDNSFYDLLASEARLGSFMAIVLNQVPQQHWFSLNRGLSESSGGKALLSWSGTMFEYLMPLLVMKDFPGTLLSETYKSVVRAQQIYARRFGVPWGISESGYSGVDFEKTYQYHAFGVPGLGLKRGLDDNLVISPYSTFLALMIETHESVANLRRLEHEGARGPYGFFEAVDYTSSRLVEHEDKHIVRSFLAHHQGMSLIAVNNVLNNGIFQERFHRDPRVRSSELLLHERFPERLPTLTTEESLVTQPEAREEQEESLVTYILTTPHTSSPRTHLVSNGQYTVMVDNVGSGVSIFDRETQLTRWREDPIYDLHGTYVFVRDLETLDVWSTTYQPTLREADQYESIFCPDKAEFKRKDFGIFLHTEITVAPEDNVEVRRVTVANLSKKRRVIELTSYGEVALAPRRADASHPAFSKMFIESKWNPDIEALIFSRRPRAAGEEVLHFLHSVSNRIVWSKTQYETSRAAFLGRGNTPRNPAVFDTIRPLAGSTGYVLDPVFAIRTQVQLEPGESEVVTFYSAASRNKDDLVRMAQKYKDAHQVARAFEMAWSQSSVELRNERMSAGQAQAYQRLANTLLFNLAKVRGRPEVIRRNRLTQSGLWRFGISGDYPIALVFLTEPGELRVVRDLLTAHYYLRTRGFLFDLVIVNEYPGGYMQNLQEELEQLVRASLSAQLIDKNGGIFIRTAQQLSREERDLLETVARVVLHGGKGSLSSQLKIDDAPEEWVPYERPEAPLAGKPAKLTENTLEFFNGIGGFAQDGQAYLLKIKGRELPPAPWSNVIANPVFGTLITETGGGYSWSENSRENRLTPWSNDPICDPASEVIYLRDAKSGAYWCPTPRPVFSDAEYVVEHGFGFSKFLVEIDGIESELLITISPDERVKWWQLTLTNKSGRERSLEAYVYIEWVLGVLREDSYRFLVTAFDEPSETLYVNNPYNNEFANEVAFIGSDHHVTSYTGRRSEFVGRFRDLGSPGFLERTVPQPRLRGIGKHEVLLTKRIGAGRDAAGVLQVPVTIPAGKTEVVRFFLGVAPSQDAFRGQAGQCCAPGAFEKAMEGTQEFYNRVCRSIQVQTPDTSFDLMMNGWLQYQNVSCRLFGRTAFYQSGGAYGFRDQLQDSLALLYTDPEMTRKQILLHASRQFVEGDVQHWWHPPTGRGVRTRFSDDLLWLPYSVIRYIAATGYRGILDEEVSYLGGQHLQDYEHEAYIVPYESDQRGSIYEHCTKAIDRSLKFGEHGLPLIGSGDWNDGMNEVGIGGRGESVWLGWFLMIILKEFSVISEEIGDYERSGKYKDTLFFLQNAMEKEGWDGSWYRRAYFDNGTPLGSSENEECRIDSLTQSWSVISGLGNPQRTHKAMDEVYEQLVDKDHKLIKLLTPPFDRGGLRPGYIKGYLPGIRENGAQYTHAAAWVIMAAALLGQGKRAVELFNTINPINHAVDGDTIETYRGEPYVTAGDVYSQYPYAGRAGWTWYSGSAGWLYQVGLEHILGLRMGPGFFTVDPCVDPSWKKFRIDFRRANVIYRINVENPTGVERGVIEVSLDDETVEDRNIPLIDSPMITTREVRVVMG